MDDIVEDTRREVEVMLTAWQTQGQGNGGIFRPRVGGTLDTPRSDDSGEFYTGETSYSDEVAVSSKVRFVLSGARDRQDGTFTDDDPVEIKGTKASRLTTVSPGESPAGETANSSYFEVA